jgi:hypothetical protein
MDDSRKLEVCPSLAESVRDGAELTPPLDDGHDDGYVPFRKFKVRVSPVQS